MNELSKKIRLLILDMIYKSRSSHIGSCYSVVEILVFIFKIQKKKDFLIMSKGHAAAAFYAYQFFKGKITKKNIKTFNSDGSYLSGHVTKNKVTKADFSTGSLGHGLSVSLGLAISNNFFKNNKKVFCIISDGELNEGSTMEALYYAPSRKLNNLVVFLDYNKIQSYDFVKNIIDYKNIASKLKLIGWNTIEIKNGHNLNEFNIYKEKILSPKNKKPIFVICNTIKGFGVKEFENNNMWHYKNPDVLQYKKFLKEIKNA